MAVISACLPPMRPIFRGMSPESILGSIRERISLHSMRGSNHSKESNGSKGSKGSHPSRRGFSNLKDPRKPETESTSSQIELHSGPKDATELEISSAPSAELAQMEEEMPKDRIVITKSFRQAESNV